MADTSSTLLQKEFFRTEFLKHPNQDELENNALVAKAFYKQIAKKWQSIYKMDMDVENQVPPYTFRNFTRDLEQAHAVGSDKENSIDVDMDVEVDAIANIMNVMHLTSNRNGAEANSNVNVKTEAGEGGGCRKRESSAASSPETDDCDMEPAIPKRPNRFHQIV